MVLKEKPSVVFRSFMQLDSYLKFGTELLLRGEQGEYFFGFPDRQWFALPLIRPSVLKQYSLLFHFPYRYVTILPCLEQS